MLAATFDVVPTCSCSPAAAIGFASFVSLAACSLSGLSGGATADADGGGGTEAGSDATSDRVEGPACPGCEVIVSGEDHPTEILVVGDKLFWIRSSPSGHVVSSRSDGTSVSFEDDFPIAEGHDLIVSGNEPYALSADGEMKRYLSYSTCEDAKGIRRLASFGDAILEAKPAALVRGDCGGSTTLVDESVTAVAGDPPYAWFANAGGSIVRCDASSTQCTASRSVLADGQAEVTTLARDDTRVYWVASGSPPEIRSRLKSSVGTTGPVDVVARSTQPKTLAPAGANVYWTDIEDGTIVRAPSAGGPATIVARGLSRPWGLALSPTHIYVTESGAGRIVRLPR